jgi:hypothetical protein
VTERAHRTRGLVRYLGAAALLGVGLDHIQQYFGASYSAIPTIGTLFALNFASAVLLAAGLIAPIERIFPRAGNLILGFLAASGIGVAMGSVIALLVSEQTPLFGFMEHGYRQAISISIVLEVTATLLLGAFMAGLSRSARKRRPAATTAPVSTHGASPGRPLPVPLVHRDVH